MLLGDAFDRSLAAHAGRVAVVVDGARRVTYRELGARADRLALHLAERGVTGGRRVVFQLPNSLEFVVAYLACLKVGAVPVACLPAHRHAESQYLARFTEAAAWFIPAAYRGFDYVARAQELRDALPALEHMFVAGEDAAAGMHHLDALLEDASASR
jgi:non-ribosomal peptide synthetase component E (peptide arylation enzyme)